MLYKNKLYFNTYADLQKIFSTCRNPTNGKKLSSWAMIFKEGDTFYLSFGQNFRFAKVTPDNVFEFLITPEEGRRISVTLSASLHYCTPMNWARSGVSRYKLIHDKPRNKLWDAKKPDWRVYRKELRKASNELFCGIRFCLTTGECLNPKPDILTTANSDARKEWLRKLRVFKRAVNLRIRIGAFDGMANTMLTEGRFESTDHIHLFAPEGVQMLYEAIRDENVPTELMMQIILNANNTWRPTRPTGEQIKKTVDKALYDSSLQLRKKFNVFDVTMEDINDEQKG